MTGEDVKLPFNPLRSTLYSAQDLFAEFSVSDSSTYGICADIQIYSYFVRYGKNPTNKSAASTLEALHDNSISLGVQKLLTQYPRAVAIMGGHKMVRGSDAYKATALLAYALARNGILVASGGGPGAMEATHLGALFSKQSPKDLKSAITSLTSHPTLPQEAITLVNPDGTINPEIAKALHEWFSPTMSILAQFASNAEAGVNLSVPNECPDAEIRAHAEYSC